MSYSKAMEEELSFSEVVYAAKALQSNVPIRSKKRKQRTVPCLLLFLVLILPEKGHEEGKLLFPVFFAVPAAYLAV